MSARGGGLTYRVSDGRWIARIQLDGVRHTASWQGPNTVSGRAAAERMLRGLIDRANGRPPRRSRRGQVWPIEPLLDAGLTRREVAAILGLTDRTGYRWAHQTVRLTDDEADRAATEVGLHPSQVWPDWA